MTKRKHVIPILYACVLSPNISNVCYAECMCKHQNVFTSCSKWIRHNMMPLCYISISFLLYSWVLIWLTFLYFFGSFWDLARAQMGACRENCTVFLKNSFIYIDVYYRDILLELVFRGVAQQRSIVSHIQSEWIGTHQKITTEMCIKIIK